MCEINYIDSNIVSLHPDAELFEVRLILLQGMADEYNDSLPLALVLSVFQAELTNLDSIGEIGFPIYTSHFWLTIISYHSLMSMWPIALSSMPMSLV